MPGFSMELPSDGFPDEHNHTPKVEEVITSLKETGPQIAASLQRLSAEQVAALDAALNMEGFSLATLGTVTGDEAETLANRLSELAKADPESTTIAVQEVVRML